MLSTVVVLILYNKSDKKHPMSPRVQKICLSLGKLLCYKPHFSKEIVPTNIEVKEIQSDDSQSNHNKGEEIPKLSKANKEFNKEKLCCCWKDAARILDKTFFVFYSSSVFISTVILVVLMRIRDYPPRHCT